MASAADAFRFAHGAETSQEERDLQVLHEIEAEEALAEAAPPAAQSAGLGGDGAVAPSAPAPAP